MKSKDARIGMRVRVQKGCKKLHLRGLVGIIQHIQQRYGDDGDAAIEVWFRDGRTELFEHHELEKAT